MIHIQSISDIITNSSSETFMILNLDAVDKVKDIVNKVLALAGYGFSWEDFFEISEGYDEDDALDRYHNRHEEDDDYDPEYEPSKAELDQFVHDYNEDRMDYGEGTLIDTYIEVKPLNQESKKAAEALRMINDLFQASEQSC